MLFVFVDLHPPLQKVTRKLHLSKTKNAKFNDSGSLVPFYFAATVWGTDIIMKVAKHPKCGCGRRK